MWLAIKSLIALIVSALLTVFPGNAFLESFDALQLAEKNDNCLLNAAIMSDIHIDVDWPIGEWVWANGLNDLERSVDPIDALIVPGDLTNYADEESLADFYDVVKQYSPAQAIIAAGNHDIGHVGDKGVTNISREEAKQNVIKYYNEYSNQNLTTNYYSLYVNGYKFIVLGDDVLYGGSWDDIRFSQEQLDFLDRELAEGTKDGLPTFVLCHWGMSGINGENTVYEDTGIDPAEFDVKGIMEKYKNVYYISGHMHSGFKSKFIEKTLGLSNAEQVNGVTYLNLPSFGFLNMYGYPWPGTGAQLEVYEDKVVFRPRNYLTEKWFENCEYTFKLEKKLPEMSFDSGSFCC